MKNNLFVIFAVVLLASVLLFKFYPDFFSFNKKTNSAVIEAPASREVPENDEPKDKLNDSNFIYVDLSGAVQNPGVYKLPSTYRMGDLISQGGGFSKNASVLWISRNLNLSKPLKDTQKIYVPFEWETYGDCDCAINSLYVAAPLNQTYSANNNLVDTEIEDNKSLDKGNIITTKYSDPSDTNIVQSTTFKDTVTPTESSNSKSKTNINTSSISDLDLLPGIGPSYAQKIIDNRPYKDLTELITKSKVPKTTLQKLSDEISF